MQQQSEADNSAGNEMLTHELVLSSLVHEITRVVHSASTLDQGLESFLLGVVELTGVQNLVLFALQEGGANLKPLKTHGLSDQILAEINTVPIGESVTECLHSLRHIFKENLNNSDPFHKTQAKSYLLMPITARMPQVDPDAPSCIRPLGVLWLDATPPEAELTGQTIPHLTGLVQQAGLMMETFYIQKELANTHAKLKSSHEQLNDAYAALSEAQKLIDDDLNRARIIQNSLLPSAFPNHLLRRIAAKYIPAGMVGGDYYDCIELNKNTLGIVVADVSGHGIGAALVMSMFKVLLHTFSEKDPSPCSVLNRINATFMQQQLGAAKYVTAFYAIFDKAERKLTYCNAGHVGQLLFQNPNESLEAPGNMVEMASSGLVLGMFNDTFLKDTVLTLTPEARLFLFTDGITEAHGTQGTMFGIEPILELVRGSGDLHPGAIIDSLMKARCIFLGGSEQATGELADDATVVILDL